MNITKDDIGMRVYSIRYGWGRIYFVSKRDTLLKYLSEDDKTIKSVHVDFQTGKMGIYTRCGRLSATDVHNDLYWDKPEIIEPPKPKRKVKKTYYYMNSELAASRLKEGYAFKVPVYDAKSKLIENSRGLDYECIQTIELEVEE